MTTSIAILPSSAASQKIAGTRICVELVLERRGDGWTVDQLLAAYPHLTAEQIHACQAFAAAMPAEVDDE